MAWVMDGQATSSMEGVVISGILFGRWVEWGIF